jgi:predicted thioredoxin/glutaredoxin
VQSYYLFAAKNGLIIPAARVEKGDMFMVWNRRLNRYAHIGFVREMNHMQGTFLTVEGNSGSDGIREGVMVCSNRRRITPAIKFMKW